MKLVIEIDENVFTRLFDNGIQDNEIAVDDVCEMARALRKGTPLPEHHGDLKDVNSFEASCFMGSSMFYTQSDIEYAETIIPATERSNNADCN